MYQGTVKWFDSKKGYGFIVGPEGKDIFVHFSVIEGEGFRALRDGEEVEYDFKEGDKGLLANTVRRLNLAPAVDHRVIRQHAAAPN
jgi:CspA family cold shock protein